MMLPPGSPLPTEIRVQGGPWPFCAHLVPPRRFQPRCPPGCWEVPLARRGLRGGRGRGCEGLSPPWTPHSGLNGRSEQGGRWHGGRTGLTAAGRTDVPPDRRTPGAPAATTAKAGLRSVGTGGANPPFFGSGPALLARCGDAVRSRRFGSRAGCWALGGSQMANRRDVALPPPRHAAVGRVGGRRRGCRNVRPSPPKSNAPPGKDGQNGIPGMPQNGWEDPSSPGHGSLAPLKVAPHVLTSARCGGNVL